MMRADYVGAVDLFTEILERASEISVTNELDIRLLRGIALELGRSGLRDFEVAGYQLGHPSGGHGYHPERRVGAGA